MPVCLLKFLEYPTLGVIKFLACLLTTLLVPCGEDTVRAGCATMSKHIAFNLDAAALNTLVCRFVTVENCKPVKVIT